MMDFDELRRHLKSARPKAPPAKATVPPASLEQAATVVTQAVSAEKASQPVEVQAPLKTSGPTDQWFVQKGTNRYGPLSYHEVVQALQEKTVYDFDFICQAGADSWQRVAEHEAFQTSRIRELAETMRASSQSAVFTKRQFPRRPFESDVIVHDERSAWVGHCYEASAGGSGLVIESSTLIPGQVINLHFSPAEGLPAFNALGEIVGKKYSKEVQGAKSPVRYAVRFLQIGPKGGSLEHKVREHFTSHAHE